MKYFKQKSSSSAISFYFYAFLKCKWWSAISGKIGITNNSFIFLAIFESWRFCRLQCTQTFFNISITLNRRYNHFIIFLASIRLHTWTKFLKFLGKHAVITVIICSECWAHRILNAFFLCHLINFMPTFLFDILNMINICVYYKGALLSSEWIRLSSINSFRNM